MTPQQKEKVHNLITKVRSWAVDDARFGEPLMTSEPIRFAESVAFEFLDELEEELRIVYIAAYELQRALGDC